MFESIVNFFKRIGKQEKTATHSKDAAKERLHLVLMQDRANVSADFLDLMKQEIIEVIKKYIDVDENEIDVRLANKPNEDGTTGAPALYANIPIISIKDEAKKGAKKETISEEIQQEKKEEAKENEEKIDNDKDLENQKEHKEVVEKKESNKECDKEGQKEEKEPQETSLKEENANNETKAEDDKKSTVETKK